MEIESNSFRETTGKLSILLQT